MIPKLSLWDVFAAYWDELTGEARRRHVAVWLVDWGAAMASHYRRCAYCERLYSPIELAALERVDVAPPSTVEIRHCSCGSSLIIERTKK